MTAYLAIVRWEIRYYLRRISTWVYFVIFFAIAYLFMLVAGGAFKEVNVALGSGGKVLANAPAALAALIPILSLFGVSITAALAGNALYKDYESRMDPLFYTTPVSKPAFFGGRYTGILIVNVIVVAGIGLGTWMATISPWVDADKIGHFRLMSYVQPYLGIVLPNVVLTAALFFGLVALTRQMLPNYVGGALLLVGYLLAQSLLADIQNKDTWALLDPFGMTAMKMVTRYWTPAEQNSRLVPITGILLENRLLWLGVAAALFVFAYARFQFAHALGDTARPLEMPKIDEPAAAEEEAAVAEPVVAPLRLHALPATTQRFDLAARWVQFRSVFARSFARIVRSRYFGAIVAGGLLYLIVAARATGKLFGTTTWPVTYQIENVLSGSFGTFILVIIVFYSGELVWAERDAKLNQIYDATPVTNVVTFMAKFAALMAMILALLGLTMLAGIVTQAARGYYRFEIPLYLQSLLGFRFVDYLLIAVLAMTVHVLVNHKYLGHFLIILLIFGMGLLSALGLESNLYQYASDSGSQYSDMNGWGPYVWPYVWWKLYWGAVAVLLLVLSGVYWVRGEERSFEMRTMLARARFHGKARRTALGAGTAFVLLGGFIFYNTNILNTFRSSKADRRLRAERERLYKRFENIPQPRIVGIALQVDLFPEKRDAIVTGRYVLKNKTRSPIDSVHIGIDENLEIRRFDFEGGATRVLYDRPRNYVIWRLAHPVAPGDSIVLQFTLARITHGFANEITDNAIAGNGTFLENVQFMPTIGYDAREEIQDDETRKKEALPPRDRMRPPTDPSTWRNNYISHDADWLTYEATVSTDLDQTALTSGYLQKEWTANGRRYFQYRMDAPILNLWAFQSARYAIKHAMWHPAAGVAGDSVDIAVLYHPTHAYNVDRMIDAARKALTYYTTNFSPYQYHQIRIVEFPRYAAFAQSLPNTIPFSEAIGFIARVESADDVDYPFYVTAHEVAHQWWAHQVIGADAQGSTMLSETMAQYSALMVMEKEFGPANMRKFLEYELNSYLLGRSTERHREMPLELGENQPYIHYNKGSLVTYALRDYLGETRMNAAVRGFLNATKFRGPPYPTSLQLVDSLRAATPDSLKYLITDLFETITLYELKTDSVTVRNAADAPGKFAVDVYVTAKKVRADSLGKETEVPMNDWIDLGVFAKPPARPDPRIDAKVGVPLFLQKRRIQSGRQRISVVVDQMPYRAGIDPLHKLIDRVTTDNTQGVLDRRARHAAR
jgi:ABC-type transport system involved in multi-copper enzyme maturation permease subunit